MELRPSDVVSGEAFADVNLDVYVGTDGHWNPEHGLISIPAGWEFLATGDAFLTRRVKASGRYWLSWQPRSRRYAHRRLLGLLAPAAEIASAEQAAAETAQRRAASRVQGARHRDRQEGRYREELRLAILAFLDFAPPHKDLADQIATAAADRAAAVGSGRVGRIRNLSPDERAALAARAQIRHQHTAYHDDLERLPFAEWDEERLYREIKGAANASVNDFLAEHRA